MQIAGKMCGICNARDVAESDGMGCMSCRTVLHQRCVNPQMNVCPTCEKPLGGAERKICYSKKCPNCGRRNDPPGDQCVKCKTHTSWGSEDDYRDFAQRNARVGLRYIIQGGVELLLATLWVFCQTLVPSMRIIFVPTFLFGHGLLMIGNGLSMRRFE